MHKKRVGTVLLIGVLLSVIRTVVVIFNMEKNNYENDTYYLLDNLQSNVFTVMFMLCFVGVLALGLVYGKGKRAVIDVKNDTASAASCMLAFIIFGSVIIYVITYVLGGETPTKFGIAVAVLSVCSAVAFLLSGLRVCNEKSLALFTMLPIFLTVARILCDFINSNSAPFASSGAYHIMSLTSLLLYFLCEGKAFIRRGSASFYYAFGYASVLLLLVYSVPNIVLHCFGVFSFDYSASLSVVDMVTVAYVCARMGTSKTAALKEGVSE